MYPDNPENPMIRGAQTALERRHAHAQREAQAYEMFVSEFLEAVIDGMSARISYGHTSAPLATILRDLLDDDVIALHLACEYAKREVERYVEIGAFDD